MKKLLYSVLALAAVAVACNKEADLADDLLPAGDYTIRAILDDETKTTYAQETAFSWVRNDQVTLVVKNGDTDAIDNYTYYAADAGKEVDLVGNAPSGAWQETGFAFYPGSNTRRGVSYNKGSDHLWAEEGLRLTLDGTITPAKDNPLAWVPIVGQKESEATYRFKTAVAVLKVTVAGLPEGADYACIYVQDEEYGHSATPLNGTFTLAEDGSIRMENVIDGASYGEKWIYFSDGVAGETRDFYFPLPVGTLPAGAVFYLYNSTTQEYVLGQEFKKAVALERNTIVRTPVITLGDPTTAYALIGYHADDETWTKDIALTPVDGQPGWFVAAGLRPGPSGSLTFKFRANGSWEDGNVLGAVNAWNKTTGAWFSLSELGSDITLTEPGTFDVYFNEAQARAFILEAGSPFAIPENEEVKPAGTSYAFIGYHGDDSWSKDVTLAPVDGQPGWYVAAGVRSGGTNISFKFRAYGSWANAYVLGAAVEADSKPLATLVRLSHPGSDIHIFGEGSFDVYFNEDEELAFVLEAGSPFAVPTVYDDGSAPVTGWNLIGINGDWNTDVLMTDKEVKGKTYRFAQVEMEAGSTLKFRKDGKWDENLGYGEADVEARTVLVNDLVELVPSGANGAVAEAGTYDIYLLPEEGTAVIEREGHEVFQVNYRDDWSITAAYGNSSAGEKKNRVTVRVTTPWQSMGFSYGTFSDYTFDYLLSYYNHLYLTGEKKYGTIRTKAVTINYTYKPEGGDYLVLGCDATGMLNGDYGYVRLEPETPAETPKFEDFLGDWNVKGYYSQYDGAAAITAVKDGETATLTLDGFLNIPLTFDAEKGTMTLTYPENGYLGAQDTNYYYLYFMDSKYADVPYETGDSVGTLSLSDGKGSFVFGTSYMTVSAYDGTDWASDYYKVYYTSGYTTLVR